MNIRKLISTQCQIPFLIVLVAGTQATAAAQESSESAKGASSLEEIIITGTSVDRAEFDTPAAVSRLDEEQLSVITSSSLGDILAVIPSIKTEPAGGEVATNLFVRGLPANGQLQFTPLNYDGIPAIATFGLNSSADDVFYRNDLGIERLEFVNGGVSNLFGAGSVAGIINFISKQGDDTPQSTVQFEVSDESRHRIDFATSGPFDDNGNYYALSGFYRYDEGPLKTGFPTEGHQLRGNFRHEFSDGSGAFTIFGQTIDDRVQFFLPFPLTSDLKRPSGNDGGEVFSVQTSAVDRLSYPTANGEFTTPIRDGVKTKGGLIAFDLNKEIGSGWNLLLRGKHSDYDHEFNLFLDGDGITSVPQTLESYLDTSGFGTVGVDDLANASYTFADNGQPVPDNYLLFGNRLLDRERPTTDTTTEIRLSKTFNWGGADHTITWGGFYSRTEAGDLNYISTYLAELNNEPRLINLSITDVDGSLTGTVGGTLVVSRNGIVNSNGETSNRDHRALRQAIFFADQIETDNWALDVGFRLEKIQGDIVRESAIRLPAGAEEFFQLGPNEFLAPNLQTAGVGSGQTQTGQVEETAFAAAIGGLYHLNDTVNLFGNISHGFYFPQIRSAAINALNETGPYEQETINQAEIGLKMQTPRFVGSASGFWVTLDDRQSTTFVNDGMGGLFTQTLDLSTETFGILADGIYAITDNFSINGNVTWQSVEFTTFDSNPANIGNEPLRTPELMLNGGLSYKSDNGFDANFFFTHLGDHFANDGNTVELDAYTVANLDVGYTFKGTGDSKLRFSVHIFNMFDEDSPDSGSPRVGDAQTIGDFFVGRPILPRRVTTRLRYDF